MVRLFAALRASPRRCRNAGNDRFTMMAEFPAQRCPQRIALRAARFSVRLSGV